MRKPTVLIADDDRHFRAALRLRLGAAGFQVADAIDGLDVLSQCPRGWVDVLIMDHKMPNGDGRAVARVIRNESEVPIVLLSGYDRSEFLPVLRELPDVYYVAKPPDMAQLIRLLWTIARRRERLTRTELCGADCT